MSSFYSSIALQRNLEHLSVSEPEAWELLIGLYLLYSGRTPLQILGHAYHRAHRWLDRVELEPGFEGGQWKVPSHPGFNALLGRLAGEGKEALETAARTWQRQQPGRVADVLRRAGWLPLPEEVKEWGTIDKILQMQEGEEKERLVALTKKDSPRFFEACRQTYFSCGVRRYEKRQVPSEDDDPDVIYEPKYPVRKYPTPGLRHIVPTTPPSRPRKPKMVNNGPGLPTQFHGVPLEERAIDSNGDRLPWSLEFHEDHPSARGQKRHVVEKGPFGRSKRRMGSSGTRTTTPAKKENPTIDGFERAMKYDLQREAESKKEESLNAQSTMLHATSPDKEPTQIILYGYAPSREYAAIDKYEKCSGGIICEDYEREPPSQLKKYPSMFDNSRPIHPRPLTNQEKSLASKYDGGEHWIKLTCDSAEAAARAVENSPQQIYGHWVYAELWKGKGPEPDVSILVTEEDYERDPFGGPRPPPRPSQTISAAFSQPVRTQTRATSTLPRGFQPNVASQAEIPPAQEADSNSPSTASSATATATAPDHTTLRNRPQAQAEQTQTPTDRDMIAPGIRRAHLRPESEAYPPLVSWWERQLQWLRAQGWIPGDFIGWQLPLNENNEFDWDKATWYWRMLYWIDTHFGTDICTLRDRTD